MRYLLFLLLFFSFPLFAGTPYCSCYQVDITDPFMRPPEMIEWLTGVTPCPGCFNHDCYGLDSTGNLSNTTSLCTSACGSKNIQYRVIGDGVGSNGLWSVAAGDCSNPKGADPLPDPDPTPDPINPPPAPSDDDSPPFPCGYPGAQYLNCNVYDAKVEEEVRHSIHALGSTLEIVVDKTTAAVNTLYPAIVGVSTSVVKLNTSVDKSNTFLETANKERKELLEKSEKAALHKDVKLTMGSCVEFTKLDARLPFLNTILSDTLLTGFTCTGDQVYCDQIKLQAQAYCRDIISQRLESMYLNGGNVFVKCPAEFPNPVFDDAGVPQCKIPPGNACLVSGQAQPVGQHLPPCYSPVTVTCPSTEFTPIIVLNGFSCDTKLNSAKFNVAMDKQQKILDALSDKNLAKVVEDNKAITEPAQDSVKTDSEEYSKPFANPKKVDPASLGMPITGGATIDDFIDNVDIRCVDFYGIKVCNPFDYSKDFLTKLIRPFISDYLYLVFGSGSGSCSMDFSAVDSQLSKMTKVPVAPMAAFSKDFCSNYVPVIRALMSFFLTWYAALYIFREAGDFAIIIASGGTQVDTSATISCNAYDRAMSGEYSPYR